MSSKKMPFFLFLEKVLFRNNRDLQRPVLCADLLKMHVLLFDKLANLLGPCSSYKIIWLQQPLLLYGASAVPRTCLSRGQCRFASCAVNVSAYALLLPDMPVKQGNVLGVLLLAMSCLQGPLLVPRPEIQTKVFQFS